jgi:hypothetical protein
VAKKPSKWAGKALREFRHEIALLKKKGLVSKRVDARKQKPTRYMRDKLKKLHDVIEGTQTSVKVDRKTAARYKASGFFVFGNRVVVSKDKDERGRRDAKSGLIVLSKLGPRAPFEKVVMPYSIKNIDQFLSECRKSPPDPQIFAARKNPQDHWAFAYHGNNSLGTFETLDDLGIHLERYVSLLDDPRMFQHLILYRVIPSFWVEATQRNIENRKRANRRRWNKDRRDNRKKANPKDLMLRGREVMKAKQETYEEMNARHQREWYQRQKERMAKDAAFAERVRKERADRKRKLRASKKRG